MTDGQSASLSWNKAPVWGLRLEFHYYQIVTGLLMWVALSDERTGLWFTTASGPRQRSHFRVQVPWDSSPYFTVSDSRLPFSSPPTTRRATVDKTAPSVFPCVINIRHGPYRKHLSSTVACVLTATLRNTGHPVVAYSLPRDVFTGPLPSKWSNASQYITAYEINNTFSK
jgi:hypothetical protein